MPSPDPTPTWYLDVPDPSDLMEGDPPAPGDRWCSLWGPRKPGGPRLPCSPSIEGTADEWLAIAEAIEQRVARGFKRVAFTPDTERGLQAGGRLRSPRNTASERDHAVLTARELDDLAGDVRAKLAPAASPPAAAEDRCEDLALPGHVGHWRDWHRGHGCVLDPDRKREMTTAPPRADDAVCLRCAIERGEAYSLRARDEPCARHAARAPGSRPPGVPTTDPAAPVHPMAEDGSGPTTGALVIEPATPAGILAAFGEMAGAKIADQLPPTPNDRPPVWELVIADMRERDRIGRERYGTPLQAFNGRDPLVDAYQEALDLAVYLRQAIEERVREVTRASSSTAATSTTCRCEPGKLDLECGHQADQDACDADAIVRALQPGFLPALRAALERAAPARPHRVPPDLAATASGIDQFMADRGHPYMTPAERLAAEMEWRDLSEQLRGFASALDSTEATIARHVAGRLRAIAQDAPPAPPAAAIDRVLADPAAQALSLDNPADRDRLREILVAALAA